MADATPPPAANLRGTVIDDVDSEAFAMHAARLVVTAADDHWLDAAVRSAGGYGTSIIGCDAEVGVDATLAPERTPDGRPGAALLMFARTADKLAAAVRNRTGQCLMTAPTTCVFDGMGDSGDRFGLGRWVRFFGDGFERKAQRHGRTGYVVPVTAGEFFCESHAGRVEAIGGATLLIGGEDDAQVLAAARRAAERIAACPDVITPFPGGVCRCGSKVGGRTHDIVATTNDAYCPTLRQEVATKLPRGVRHVYEIVIDGLSRDAIVTAMRTGIDAAAGAGVAWITSASIGGTLGDIRLPLRACVP